jgi:hypothetical protein
MKDEKDVGENEKDQKEVEEKKSDETLKDKIDKLKKEDPFIYD